MIYFAYGSNMHRTDMAARCPGAAALGVAVLGDWELMVTRDGYVAIHPRRGRTVHGVMWRISLRDLVVLDRYERAGSLSYRRCIVPMRCAGRTVCALAYRGISRVDTGRPRRDYFIRSVLGSALSWGLPGHYVAEIGRLARSGFRA